MPLQATSGAASYDAFGGGVPAAPPTYIEDVFSTWLYTGTGANQTITNNIDLSGKGGLVWIKVRSTDGSHSLFDTARGVNKYLASNATVASATDTTTLTAFNSTGFSLGTNSGGDERVNGNNQTYVSWTFREQPKFFDVVTYTTVSGAMTIPHNLGSTPGCWIIKATNATDSWWVHHRSIPSGVLRLEGTSTPESSFSTATSTNISISNGVFSAGTQIVIYLFAHDAGGFGLTGTDNVISCGSFTTDGSGNATVSLGYEPQWLLAKSTNLVDQWYLVDSMRGWPVTTASTKILAPNLSDAESTGTLGNPTATGFTFANGGATKTYIYIAIRRGPMKVPTTGTSVFAPTATAVTTGTKVTTGFVTDLQMANYLSGAASNTVFTDRLRGISNTSAASPTLGSANTNAEITTIDYLYAADNTGWRQGSFSSGGNSIRYDFRRAPSFMDVVCYTGDGTSNRQLNHNLTVTPELIIAKRRSASQDWVVFGSAVGSNKYLILNTTAASDSATIYTSTSTTFGAQASLSYNTNAVTYVAYLFATCAGVSKVFSYTGNGSSQTINCGFTGGARFVMIKATSTTGNWIVADSARGIVAGNDPALYLNSTAAEVTSLDWIDADNSGFIVNETATIAANTNGVSYIGIAIA